jgi:hypothetical protein
LPFAQTIDTTEATFDVSDPQPSCAPDLIAGSVWYDLTLAADVRVHVTASADRTAGVYVFTGPRNAPVEYACAGGFPSATARLDAAAGVTYHVMITTFNLGTSVNVSIAAGTPGPANDDFDDATEVAGPVFTDTIDTTEALKSPDDPLPRCDPAAQNTVWYRFTPADDVHVDIDTSDSSYVTRAGLYTGTRGSLAPVFADGCIPSFNATAGTTYWIMVSTQSGNSPGSLVFKLAAHKASSISLTPSSSTITFGHSVALTAHLTGFAAGSHPNVSLYAQRSGETTKKLVDSAAADDSGLVHFSQKPDRKTTYFAKWSGDVEYLPAAAKTVVRVRAIVTGRLFRSYGRAGKYRLYHTDVDPVYGATIHPGHRVYMRFTLQRHTPSGWTRVASVKFQTNRQGEVGVVINHRVLKIRTGYRIKATFRGDDRNLGDASPWAYFMPR